MIDDDGSLLKAVIPIVLASAGAAWGGVKYALNGTRKAISDGRAEARENFIAARKEARENFEALRHDVQRIDDHVRNVRERVSFMEGSKS